MGFSFHYKRESSKRKQRWPVSLIPFSLAIRAKLNKSIGCDNKWGRFTRLELVIR